MEKHTLHRQHHAPNRTKPKNLHRPPHPRRRIQRARPRLAEERRIAKPAAQLQPVLSSRPFASSSRPVEVRPPEVRKHVEPRRGETQHGQEREESHNGFPACRLGRGWRRGADDDADAERGERRGRGHVGGENADGNGVGRRRRRRHHIDTDVVFRLSRKKGLGLVPLPTDVLALSA